MAKYETHSKLFTYLDDLEAVNKEPMNRLEGLSRSPKDIIRTIEFYSNDKYLSGDLDALGREKPFYNVGNYRVTIAKTATDLDVKDIKFEPDTLQHSVESMLYNRELFKYLKESNFSKTLNDMGETRPKYGGLLVKKREYGDKLDIGVVDWVNVDFNPTSIMKNVITETHWMSPSEFADKSDVWDNVEEVLIQHSKANKNKPCNIEIKEYNGDFPEDIIDAGSEYKYKKMEIKVAIVNKKKYLLDNKDEKESPYKYLPWEAIGESLGRGVVEQGFPAQVWTNDSIITMKNANELFGKILIQTDSTKVSGNAITGVDHGHIFQLEAGRTMQVMNMGNSKLPELQNMIGLWKQQYDSAASTYDGANTGEAPTAGTPYSQTALLNQVANTPFEYQREVWGIFLNEILNDWIKPFLKKRIMKPHYLVSEYEDEELAVIDEAISDFEARKVLKDALLQGKTMSREEYVTIKDAIKTSMSKLGAKREVDIPKGFLDVEGKITANITGELKNKQAILQSLDGVLKTVVSSFNPNTGTFGVLTDPTLNKLFRNIVDMAGIPISSAELKASPTSATQLTEPSIPPVAPVAA
jgi:hypothetical protein